MNEDFLDAVCSVISLPSVVKKTEFRSVGGGSINQAGIITIDDHFYFVKWNSKSALPSMFDKEKKGLELLRENCSLRIPIPMKVGEYQDQSFLIMECISGGVRKNDFWKVLGRGLAELHRSTSQTFGLDHDNYIGSLHQSNDAKTNWSEFFVECRIQPLADRAESSLGLECMRDIHSLCNKAHSLFPEEQASLLHGDLWSGNFMCDEAGDPVIIDPAIYYGHREMDLGMTKLFGGFDADFYNAYEEAYPLIGAWQERIDLCNLYPLLVHTILFGGSYAAQVRNIAKRFS